MSVRNLSKIPVKRNKRKISFTFVSVRNLSKIPVKRNKRKISFIFAYDGILTSVRYKKNVIILKINGTIQNRKKSVAYCHSGLRPGIQYKNALFENGVSWIPGLSPE